MSLTMRDTRSGLTIAEQSHDELSLTRALKRVDERLVLQRHPSNIEGGWVYKVFKIVSEDQPAEVICTWCDDHGRPLPLSSGIVSLVESLRMGARNTSLDADTHNARLEAENDRKRDEAAEAVVDTHRSKVERGTVTVSLGSGTSKPYWLRNTSGLKGANG